MTGRFSLAALTAIWVLAGGHAAGAFPYPVAGVDGNPDFCSSRSEPVMFCVTPAANTHCEALVNEELHGIFGGLSHLERNAVERKMRKQGVTLDEWLELEGKYGKADDNSEQGSKGISK